MKKKYGFLLELIVVLILGILSINDSYAQCKIRTDTQFVDGCSGPWLPSVHVTGFDVDAKQLFESACNRHDQCYHSCRCSKDLCDEYFRNDMNAICERMYPYDPITFMGHDIGDKNAGQRYACYTIKDAFYEAVKRAGGSSYSDAQKRAGCN